MLVGGLGTRLRRVTGDTPKPLVRVRGRPFLEWLLISLRRRGARRIVLCTGYGHQQIEATLGDGRRLGVRLRYSVEPAPAGTAGAVALALPLLADPFVLWNGDTYSGLDWRSLLARHLRLQAVVTIALVPVANVSDFGRVVVDQHDRVVAFEEKTATGPGLVNAGVYAINHASLDEGPPGKGCSLEREVLPRLVRQTGRVYAYYTRRPVLDIGTPDRLKRFEEELSRGHLVHS